jgi:cyclin H
MKLSEDDLYRTSTQFNHWSFTTQQLASQRLKTNIQATERVKANVARQRAQRLAQAESDSLSSGVENGSGANTPLPDRSSDFTEVDCLSAGEELQIVDEFCDRALQLGAHCQFPIEVTASFWIPHAHESQLTVVTGNMCPVPAPLLPLQFTHDVPRPKHLAHRHVPRL